MEHVIIDTGLGKGVSEYGNMGDISMLQAAVDRLHKVFPSPCIQVLTESPENLARFCPAARPLDNRGRSLWLANGVLLGRFAGLAPKPLISLLVRLKRAVRSWCPGLFTTILVRRLKRQNRAQDAEAVRDFTRALRNADLYLICGAGGFYDGSHTWSMDILDLLETAVQTKKPAIMVGQGFGPLSDPVVLKRAAKLLPQVQFITLRGGRDSSAFLRSLGVAESKMETTGDEALELAYDSRAEQAGHGLGINLRFAGSAATDDDDIQKLRPILQGFARQHNAPLIPLPIAMHASSRDDLTIKQLLIGYDEGSDGGNTLDSPLKVMKQAARCRVVVTGAYHAAVFSLAQGIPVIGLAKSAYFAGKFLGLKDQFGEGCQTILLNEQGWPERLTSAIDRAWQDADELRGTLQAAALRQIDASRKSYERVRDLVKA